MCMRLCFILNVKKFFVSYGVVSCCVVCRMVSCCMVLCRVVSLDSLEATIRGAVISRDFTVNEFHLP